MLNVSRDRVLVQTEVGTNSGNFYSDQEFMVLDIDVDDVVMGVQWRQDLAPEDKLLEYWDLKFEVWESSTFNPDFPDLNRLQETVKNHGNVFIALRQRRAKGGTLKFKGSSSCCSFYNAAMSVCTRGNSLPKQGIVGSTHFGKCFGLGQFLRLCFNLSYRQYI